MSPHTHRLKEMRLDVFTTSHPLSSVPGIGHKSG
jgi:hypothetical protein